MRTLAVVVGLMMSAAAAAETRDLPIVAATGNGTTSILLLRFDGSCPKGSHEVVGATPSEKSISAGCWVLKNGTVYIVPDVGDPFTLPEKAFTWMDAEHRM